MLAILAAGINLMPDWTIIVQLGIFAASAAVIYIFILKPTLKIIDRRHAFTADARLQAETLNSEAQRLDDQRTREIKAAVGLAIEHREEIISTRQREADKIISDARAEAKRIADSTETSVELSEAAVSADMEAQSTELAKEIERRAISGAVDI